MEDQTNKLKKWLVNQLTKTKQQEESWSDLAESLGELIAMHVEGLVTRLKARNSLYDMNKQDLEVESIELRKVFPLGDVKDEDLPHAIMQRRDEIHFKKTVYPLISTIAREFAGMEVSWEKLYAPIDQERFPYGELFALESELNDFHDLEPEDFFLTSRGVIRIPITKIQSGQAGIGEEEIRKFEEKVKRVIYPLIPLRIVCSGQIYYIKIELSELVEWVEYSDTITNSLSSTQERPSHTEFGHNEAHTIVSLNERKTTSPIYATPRMDANPMDAVILDRVYY